MSNDKIIEQLEKVRQIVGYLCKDGRCPSMSIPVRSSDEDVIIYDAIAAAIKALSGDKITGWVAWHPEGGARTVALSKVTCESHLTGVRLLDFERYEEYSIAHESELRRFTDNGWQIREVELRFTDEEEKQDENDKIEE